VVHGLDSAPRAEGRGVGVHQQQLPQVWLVRKEHFQVAQVGWFLCRRRRRLIFVFIIVLIIFFLFIVFFIVVFEQSRRKSGSIYRKALSDKGGHGPDRKVGRGHRHGLGEWQH
jgi:hypothetical protein